MHSDRIQAWVFTDSVSHRVLHIKRTRGMDYSVSWPEILVYRLNDEDIANAAVLQSTYGPRNGFGAIDEPPAPREYENRKKLEVLLLLRTGIELMKSDIRRTYSEAAIAGAPLGAGILQQYAEFMRAEKETVLARVVRFYERIERDIAACADGEAAKKIYQRIQHRVDLGVFSATNQERKNLHVGSERGQ
jgi:hypothetical protein